MKNEVIRVIDLETTGTEPPADIVEIGAWNVCLDDRERVVDRHHETYVSGAKTIPPEAQAVHHIRLTDLVDAPNFEAAWEDFRVWPHENVHAFCAHKADFEKKFLGKLVQVPWICTWRVALRLWPEAPNHQNQTLRYYLGLETPVGLRDYANRAHRAGPDALVTALILQKALTMATVEQMVEWSSKPGLIPLCTLKKHKGKPWAEVPTDYLEWMLRQADMDPDLVYNARHHLNLRRAPR